jgi:hypothetical protein
MISTLLLTIVICAVVVTIIIRRRKKLSKNEVNQNLRKANIELYDDIDSQYDKNYYEKVDYEKDYYEKVDYETIVEKDITVEYDEIFE